jgi:uncharacterized membrane protein YfcA
MDPASLAVVAVTGIGAGAINTIAGAGSLLTYPVLVAVGLPPLAANVTNDIGVVPGNISGAVGLRANLEGQRPLLRRLVPRVVVGSLVGAVLLLVAPASAFAWAAPPLLLVASALTLAQPALARRSPPGSSRRRPLHAAVDAIAVYGGYFGTGIGLLFMATLGLFVDEDLHRLNAVKTILQLLANGLAGVLFALVAPVHWYAAAALAGGSLAGGQVGAWVAARIPAAPLRVVVAVIGLAAGLWLLARQL